MDKRGFNFNPGPAVLPEPVLRKAQGEIWNYRGSGMGVAELSHRGSHFEEIIRGAEQLLRELLGIPEDQAVLFCTGGATQQFSMVPLNLLAPGTEGNYLLSGVWAEYASEEAKKFGAVCPFGSSKDWNYCRLPQPEPVSEHPAYLHYTSNNTVIGTQFPRGISATLAALSDAPVICDASSDILSRPIDTARHGIIYAGAQKNLGPAGVTIVIFRRSLAERIPDGLPLLLDYRTFLKNSSLYNTPPTLTIYLVREVLEWVKAAGGVEAMERRNQEKAALVYARIDATDFYEGIVDPGSRSTMNLTFRLKDKELEKDFLKQAEARELFGLKGHRLLGGFRASMYNAFPLAGAEALVEFMNDFEKQRG